MKIAAACIARKSKRAIKIILKFIAHLKSQTEYSPIFTDPEENNCFSIITQVNIIEIEKKAKICMNLLQV
jgi:hypothetical protein